MMNKERAAALVVKAIIETIDETGENGAPLGIMYAALMGMIGYDSFMSVIDALQKAGIIKVSNHVAYINKSGIKLAVNEGLEK